MKFIFLYFSIVTLAFAGTYKVTSGNCSFDKLEVSVDSSGFGKRARVFILITTYKKDGRILDSTPWQTNATSEISSVLARQGHTNTLRTTLTESDKVLNLVTEETYTNCLGTEMHQNTRRNYTETLIFDGCEGPDLTYSKVGRDSVGPVNERCELGRVN